MHCKVELSWHNSLTCRSMFVQSLFNFNDERWGSLLLFLLVHFIWKLQKIIVWTNHLLLFNQWLNCIFSSCSEIFSYLFLHKKSEMKDVFHEDWEFNECLHTFWLEQSSQVIHFHRSWLINAYELLYDLKTSSFHADKSMHQISIYSRLCLLMMIVVRERRGR